MRKAALCLLGVLTIAALPARAESRYGQDYPGVADPFADPSQYEFSEEEREDKEFFHLGRFLMFGLDGGAGIFTGGLGASAGAGMMLGGRVIYFFDRSIAFELRGHMSQHLDQVETNGGGILLDTIMLSFGGGFRFYFDTRNAPRAIAIANPYLAAGGGAYMRSPVVLDQSTGVPQVLPDTSFGGYAGGGIEFLIYRQHVYLGVDLRYHMVFFSDEMDTLGGLVEVGDRAGDYMSTLLTITYSF